MDYTKACGCKILIDDSDPEIMELEYCPLHKAAPDMVEALKWVTQMASHSPTDSQVITMAIEALAKAKTEGK